MKKVTILVYIVLTSGLFRHLDQQYPPSQAPSAPGCSAPWLLVQSPPFVALPPEPCQTPREARDEGGFPPPGYRSG